MSAFLRPKKRCPHDPALSLCGTYPQLSNQLKPSMMLGCLAADQQNLSSDPTQLLSQPLAFFRWWGRAWEVQKAGPGWWTWLSLLRVSGGSKDGATFSQVTFSTLEKIPIFFAFTVHLNHLSAPIPIQAPPFHRCVMTSLDLSFPICKGRTAMVSIAVVRIRLVNVQKALRMVLRT